MSKRRRNRTPPQAATPKVSGPGPRWHPTWSWEYRCPTCGCSRRFPGTAERSVRTGRWYTPVAPYRGRYMRRRSHGARSRVNVSLRSGVWVEHPMREPSLGHDMVVVCDNEFHRVDHRGVPVVPWWVQVAEFIGDDAGEPGPMPVAGWPRMSKERAAEIAERADAARRRNRRRQGKDFR